MSLAPTAPGALGQPLDPRATQVYLGELDAWVRARRAELDEVDAAALAAGRGAEVTADMVLSMSLWQSVQERWQLINVTFDGGRVGPVEAERLSTLVWARMDSGMSLPEACRLSDALAGQLRARLSLVAGLDDQAARVRALLAQLERLRDQVALEPAVTRPAAAQSLADLRNRVADVTARAERGGDVGGLLGPLEDDATRLERDLIVGNARRRTARDQVLAARELRTDLEAREAALTQLAATCVRTVDPAPRLAVPDVDALGPVPTTAEAITAYVARLHRVSAALTLAQQRYATALAERTELVDLLDGLHAKAVAHGIAGQPDLAASEQQARDLLAREPTPMPVARAVVATFQTWLAQLLGQKKESA